MRKFLVLAMAAAAALMVAVPAMAATSATHDVLTISKVGGTNVKVNAILKANLKSGTKATFETSGGMGVTCKAVTFTDQVTKNPKEPGTAVEKLKAQTFSKCTTNFTDATGVKSVTLSGLPYKTTLSDSKGDPVTVSGTTATISLDTIFGKKHPLTCTYHATTTKGTATNATQTITFSDQLFKKTAGTTACPTKGHFSATFGPVEDTSVKGDPHVFVN